MTITGGEAKKLLNKFKTIPLSDKDIFMAMDKRCNIIVYNDLEGVEDIREILGRNGCCVILYQTSPTFGHWICVIEHKGKKGKTLEVFDSLGMKVDKELEWVPDELYKGKLLTNLIDNSGYKTIIYNNYKLQADKKSNACGKWCVLRMKMKKLPLQKFIKLFISKEAKKTGNPDMLCSTLYWMFKKGLIPQ